MDRPVNILFVGSGAIGCLYGSRLHHPTQGLHVSLVARSNYPQLAAAGAVHLTTQTFGDYDFRPTAIYPSIAAAAASGQQWDFIWVTTKALPDRGDDPALIAPLVGPASAIVLIQNGVGIEAPYRLRFPTTPIVTGVAFCSAEQTAPGIIKHHLGTRLPLGPYTTTTTTTAAPPSSSSSSSPPPPQALLLVDRGTAATTRLAAWLTTHGGIPDIDTHDAVGIQLIRWHKLAINAALNPTSILCGGRGGGVMARDAELHAHLAGVMREIWAATPRILGIPLHPQTPPNPQYAMYQALEPPDATLEMVKHFPDSRPSMLQDWEAGRPLEVEIILGNPVRIAQERGVELPRTQSLYAIVKSMQAVRDAAIVEAKETI